MQLRRCATLIVSASITLVLSGPAAGGIVRTYNESFSTTAYRDDAETTVDWNIGAGELRLFEFKLAQTGGLTTPTNATGIAIDGDYAYVSDFSSGLFTVDISDPALPVLLSTFPAVGQAVVVSGNYVFLAAGTAGLKIVSVTNPSAPTLVGSVVTTGANGVALDGNYAYVADGSSGLRVISISNPASPSIVTTVNTSGSATDVEVNGNYVYVGDGATGCLVFEVTNPASPLLIATIDTPGNAFGIDVRGNRLYVSDSTGELLIYDVTSPFVPGLVGSIVLSLSGDVFANAQRAYVAASNSGIHVVDISDETSPQLLHTYNTTTARDVVVEGDLAYVADGSRGLRIIQVASKIGEQVITGSNESIGHGFDSQVLGTLAYVANGADGLAVVDITDLTNPVLRSTYNTPNTLTNVAVSGRHAYLGDGASLLVVNVFNPDSPVLIGSAATPASVEGLCVDGNLVYLGCGASGLRIYNVSNPASPTLAGSFDTPGSARGVLVSGNRAYLADAGNGLLIFDVTNPATPTLLGSYSSPSALYNVAVGGNVAYVANRFSVLVVDVTNPATPTLISTLSGVPETLALGLEGDRLYLPDLVVDVSDPTNPEVLYSLDGSSVFGPEPIGSHLVVSYQGLRILMVQQDSFDGTRTRGQSSSLPAASIPIVRARVATLQSGDLDWELTDNGGTSWQSATPDGALLEFPVSASDLRWRTTHKIIVDPPADANVGQATIDWFYESAESDWIADVPGDQGGSARIHFGRSGYDFVEESTTPVTGYQIYSRVDDSTLRGRIATAPVPAPIDVSGFHGWASIGVDFIRVLGARTFVVSGESAAGDMPPGTWEVLAWVAATQRDQYIVRVPTNGDSTATGIPWTTYCITSHTLTPSVWYASEPDSGYSVDNIAPSVPEGLLFSAPAVLSWDPSADEDFAYYSVFGSAHAELDETAVLIGQTISTSFDVSGSLHAFYHLTATDHAGNRSNAASIESPVADAEDGSALPAMFTLLPLHPNPAHGSVEIAFELPHAEDVAAGVYDLSGRRVRTLDLGFLPPGRHRFVWDGTDNGNRRVAAGVYFVRMRSGSSGASRRLLMVE